MYKLLVADDEPIIRRGICQLVDFEEFSIDQAFEASDGSEALEILRREKIDILFADVNLPGMDGLALATGSRYGPAVAKGWPAAGAVWQGLLHLCRIRIFPAVTVRRARGHSPLREPAERGS